MVPENCVKDCPTDRRNPTDGNDEAVLVPTLCDSVHSPVRSTPGGNDNCQQEYFHADRLIGTQKCNLDTLDNGKTIMNGCIVNAATMAERNGGQFKDATDSDVEWYCSASLAVFDSDTSIVQTSLIDECAVVAELSQSGANVTLLEQYLPDENHQEAGTHGLSNGVRSKPVVNGDAVIINGFCHANSIQTNDTPVSSETETVTSSVVTSSISCRKSSENHLVTDDINSCKDSILLEANIVGDTIVTAENKGVSLTLLTGRVRSNNNALVESDSDPETLTPTLNCIDPTKKNSLIPEFVQILPTSATLQSDATTALLAESLNGSGTLTLDNSSNHSKMLIVGGCMTKNTHTLGFAPPSVDTENQIYSGDNRNLTSDTSSLICGGSEDSSGTIPAVPCYDFAGDTSVSNTEVPVNAVILDTMNEPGGSWSWIGPDYIVVMAADDGEDAEENGDVDADNLVIDEGGNDGSILEDDVRNDEQAGTSECNVKVTAVGKQTERNDILATSRAGPGSKQAVKPIHRVVMNAFNVGVGAGLENLGNTCFVNATLQCLTYTKPLLQFLLQSPSAEQDCEFNGVCLMCELGRHMCQCIAKPCGVIQPYSMLQKLKLVARHMRWGRQEDAHEFLRYLVDVLHKSCINGHQKPAGCDSNSNSSSCNSIINSTVDSSKARTQTSSIVNDIFAGYLRSQVLCLECGWRSDTFDPFLDLSLDVRNSSTLEKALGRFVLPEVLETDNAYQCERCGIKVRAEKHLTLHRLPTVLNIQLKRYSILGGKVTRHIAFPEHLDVEPYMSAGGAWSTMDNIGDTADVQSGNKIRSGDHGNPRNLVEEIQPAVTFDELPIGYSAEKHDVKRRLGMEKMKGGSTNELDRLQSSGNLLMEDGSGDRRRCGPISEVPTPSCPEDKADEDIFCPIIGDVAADKILPEQCVKFAEQLPNEDVENSSGSVGADEVTDCDAMLYTLYAVLVHEGQSTSSGHYYCYVRSLSGNCWYCLNDQLVRKATLAQVLGAEAYLLFYMRDGQCSQAFGNPDQQHSCNIQDCDVKGSHLFHPSSFSSPSGNNKLSPRVEMCRGSHDCKSASCNSRNNAEHARFSQRSTAQSNAKLKNVHSTPALRTEICGGSQNCYGSANHLFESASATELTALGTTRDNVEFEHLIENMAKCRKRLVKKPHSHHQSAKNKRQRIKSVQHESAAWVPKSLIRKLKTRARLKVTHPLSNRRPSADCFDACKVKRQPANRHSTTFKATQTVREQSTVQNQINGTDLLQLDTAGNQLNEIAPREILVKINRGQLVRGEFTRQFPENTNLVGCGLKENLRPSLNNHISVAIAMNPFGQPEQSSVKDTCRVWPTSTTIVNNITSISPRLSHSAFASGALCATGVVARRNCCLDSMVVPKVNTACPSLSKSIMDIPNNTKCGSIAVPNRPTSESTSRNYCYLCKTIIPQPVTGALRPPCGNCFALQPGNVSCIDLTSDDDDFLIAPQTSSSNSGRIEAANLVQGPINAINHYGSRKNNGCSLHTAAYHGNEHRKRKRTKDDVVEEGIMTTLPVMPQGQDEIIRRLRELYSSVSHQTLANTDEDDDIRDSAKPPLSLKIKIKKVAIDELGLEHYEVLQPGDENKTSL